MKSTGHFMFKLNELKVMLLCPVMVCFLKDSLKSVSLFLVIDIRIWM